MNIYICIYILTLLIAVSGPAIADILPQPVPENQIFTTSSIIEAVGAVSESTSGIWHIGDAGLTSLPLPRITDYGMIRSGSIAYITYKDAITTNGGQISEIKSFSLDTHAKTTGLYNIETKKVLTYTSQNGSHLMGAESYVLDIAGSWSYGENSLVCVFAKAEEETIPAFCNKVTASSKLSSVTAAQIETVGGLTAIASSASVPAALNYEISVLPDANSASGYADAIVSTTFTVSVMEGRSDGRITLGTPGTPGMPGMPGTPSRIDCFAGPGNCDALVGLLGGATSIEYEWPGGGGGVPGSPVNGDQIFANLGTSSYAAWTWSNGSWSCDGPMVAQNCQAYEAAGINPNSYTIPWGGSSHVGVSVDTFWTTISAIPPIPPIPAIPPIPLHLKNYDELAAQVAAIDTATVVVGGISQFVKRFNYQSGSACVNC